MKDAFCDLKTTNDSIHTRFLSNIKALDVAIHIFLNEGVNILQDILYKMNFAQ